MVLLTPNGITPGKISEITRQHKPIQLGGFPTGKEVSNRDFPVSTYTMFFLCKNHPIVVGVNIRQIEPHMNNIYFFYCAIIYLTKIRPIRKKT